MADPYQMLGVKEDSSSEEIRKAYRALARRWHPDRFQEGPERLWAEQKMLEINAAYNAALKNALCPAAGEEREQLSDVRRLIEVGQLGAARQALMRIATRSAEWNYLLGAILMRQGEIRKAALYFGIASRQEPGCSAYRTAYHSAEQIRNRENSPLHRLSKVFARKNRI